jgi:hypothetical protein
MLFRSHDVLIFCLFSRDELPYLETTLPQERPGTVTITPSNRRISGITTWMRFTNNLVKLGLKFQTVCLISNILKLNFK